MSNQCGPCTLCCKLMPLSPDIFGDQPQDKIPGVWCLYCEIGKGCGIYDKRPQECATFRCMWLANDTWPSWARPDLSGVVITGVGGPADRKVQAHYQGELSSAGSALLGTLRQMGYSIEYVRVPYP